MLPETEDHIKRMTQRPQLTPYWNRWIFKKEFEKERRQQRMWEKKAEKETQKDKKKSKTERSK